MPSRLLRSLGCLLLAAIAWPGPRVVAAGGEDEAAGRLLQIEALVGGRLGVAAWQAGSNRKIEHRAGERFAMCSTFKMLLVAGVLRRVDRGEEKLDRRISYAASDLLEYAPITTKQLPEGAMTVEALCAAAMEYSDNAAANLLLATLGGPAGFTAFARSLGDESTRLDRNEPSLNAAVPGDPRDTTTPTAMLGSLRALLLGEALTADSRRRLDEWMTRNTTGAALIRAGVPAGWTVGDKTGRGANATINDIAILRPPAGGPILLCIYSTESKAPVKDRETAIADVARVVAAAFAK